MKKQINKNWIFLVAPFITVIWLLVIYYAKGIYPFGDGTIINYDLSEGGVPTYFYLYDTFHGGSLFHDFSTAGGFAREMLLSFAYPTNLFMMLFSREMIIEAFSYLLIFKLATIAFTASCGFSKIFTSLEKHWLVLISLMYTFSGYNLMYHTNLDWLDSVALYPLLIAFALNLFKGKSKLPYFLTLSYLLGFHTYMAYFIVVSLIVFGGLYIFIVEDKNNRKQSIYALGVSTLAALVTSSYSVFNFLSSIFGGARYEMSESIATSINNNIDIINLFMFLGVEIVFSCLILLWFNFKKNKEIRKATIFFTVVLSLLILQATINRINLAWHGGSYAMFPFRNGYMVSFFCCCAIAFFLQRYNSFNAFKSKINVLNLILPLISLILVVFIVPYADILYSALKNFDVLNFAGQMQSDSLMYPFAGFFGLLIVAFVVINIAFPKRARMFVTAGILAVTLTLNTFVFVGNSHDSEKAVLYNNYYADCFDVNHHLSNNDEFERVNNPDLSLLTNYPYISNISAVSNWTHSLSSNHIKAFTDLGFSTVYTRIVDCGGTIFSKALLRITSSVSRAPLDNNLYSLDATSERGLNYYSNKYTLPLGLTFDSTLKNINFDLYKNNFEYQNTIYSSLNNKNALFEPLKYSIVSENFIQDDNKAPKNSADNSTAKKESKSYKSVITFKPEANSVIYLQALRDTDESSYITSISINGKQVYVPQYLECYAEGDKNTHFPSGYNNGILELGCFEAKEYTLEFEIKDGTMKNIALYSLDLREMEDLCLSYSTSSYTVSNDTITFNAVAKNNNDIVFVPMTFDERWDCTVNGKSVEPICVLGNFIGIEVDKGENEIKLEFSHKEAFVAYVVMIILFSIGLAIILIEEKIPIKAKWIHCILYIAFAVIVLGTIGYLYIIPIIKTIISVI